MAAGIDFSLNDDIAALASAPGHGLRSVIRISGPGCIARLSRIFASTCSSPSELARLLEISISALSLASGFTDTRSVAFEPASILLMIVEEGSAFSSSISSAQELPAAIVVARPAAAA